MEYPYPHFSRRLLREGSGFSRGTAPGRPFPDFDLPTVDGRRVRKQDFLGQPFLFTFASYTCPMTASARPVLERLYDQFGHRVGFVSLYVREAHPGERFRQPQAFEQKLAHAQAYRKRDRIPWTVAVDDIGGSLHRALDPWPNAVYVVDARGAVAFRALWASERRPLQRALEAAASGRRPAVPQREGQLIALLRGLGKMDEVLRLAGREAWQDVRRTVPPLLLLARLARLFHPLPPLGRALAALATVGLAAFGLVWAGASLRGRRTGPTGFC